MCTEQERVIESSRRLVGGESATGDTAVAEQAPLFDTARVNAALTGSLFYGRLHHFATIESTQTQAIADAHAGADSGQVYVADTQTAGRGRGGHTWHSEPGSGLYATVLVRPFVRVDDVLLISLAAGIAAQAAIRDATGQQIDLRWPNDLVTPGPGSLKLGGILTETALQPDGRLRYAAIGVGVNLNQAQMPEELRELSTSLRMLTGRRTTREDLLIALLLRLEAALHGLEQEPATVLESFAACSTWARGKRVHVPEGKVYTGVTAGLTEKGLLRVVCDDGRERVVRHGGVRELP